MATVIVAIITGIITLLVEWMRRGVKKGQESLKAEQKKTNERLATTNGHLAGEYTEKTWHLVTEMRESQLEMSKDIGSLEGSMTMMQGTMRSVAKQVGEHESRLEEISSKISKDD